MTDKKDLRFRKTELSIRAAFFELLKSRRISEITVAEISRKAMLGRGLSTSTTKTSMTFWTLLRTNMSKPLEILLTSTIPSRRRRIFRNLRKKLFRYITAHEEQLRLLFHHISTRSFIDRLIIRQRYVFSRLVEEGAVDAAYNAVETSFMISGFAGVILDYWFLGSLPLSEKKSSII